MSIEVVETHTILPDIISPGSIVVGIAEQMLAAYSEMIRRFGCLCYAIEAAPDTFSNLARTRRSASCRL